MTSSTPRTTASRRSTSQRQYVFTLGCPDRTGIVAAISSFIAAHGGSIAEAAYHADADSGWFFTRQAVDAGTIDTSLEQLRAGFGAVASEFGSEVEWALHDSAEPKRIVVLVSKEMHCLHDLLGRNAQGELPGTIVAVVGNHPEPAALIEAHGVPFHHIPFPKDPEDRAESFAALAKLVDSFDADAIVLARFMQVLPSWLCDSWVGRALNIHHSFLPSFVGARPYHQAFARGVKLIGATCHYVTGELDAGPIIEQDVIRVDHSDTIPDLVRQGRDIEKLVLARGLRWHLQDRILVHGRKTVVFD